MNRSQTPVQRRIEEGFSLIELLVALVIIGVLAGLALYSFWESKERARISATATELKQLTAAFEAYFASNESYPPDSHLEVPPGMEGLIPQGLWENGTPLGGTYNWEGLDGYPYAGISIFESRATDEVLRALDRILDNGDLATGKFRITPNGRPTYVVWE